MTRGSPSGARLGPTDGDPVAVTSDAATEGLSLGQLAIRGGSYLFGREAIGTVVRLAGVVVVVRLIGPSAFGLYSAAAAFSLFMASFAQMGLEVYLIRLGPELRPRHYNQAFSLLLVLSVAIVAIGEGLSFAVGGLLRPVGVLLPLRVLLACIPLNVLWAPAQAAIERRFDYRIMGAIELIGDAVLYATAIPLALTHHQQWSLVAGFFAWQGWLFVATWVASGLRYRWDWSFAAVSEFFRHGLGFSSSDWLRRAGDLINPLVVGTFFGAAGVGYVAFAQRLVDTVGFAKRSAFRLGLVALSRVPDQDQHRLRSAIEEGSLLQLLSLAIPYGCVSVLARWVVPVVFGSQWTKSLPVFALLALATTASASGLIQSTFLYSRGRNLAVARAVVLRDLVLGAAALVLVRRLGIDGFGLASLVALGTLGYLHVTVRRSIAFSYRRIWPWLVALGPSLLFPMVPMPDALALLAPLLLIALRPMRAELAQLVRRLRQATTRSPALGSAASPQPNDRALGVLSPAGPGQTLEALFEPDQLTGLPGLVTFSACLGSSLWSSQGGRSTVGVVLAELCEPARPTARELRALATRLVASVRGQDLVARLGPATFGVQVTLPYEVDLGSLAERIGRVVGTNRPGAARYAFAATHRGTATSPEALLQLAAARLHSAHPVADPERPWLRGLRVLGAGNSVPSRPLSVVEAAR